MTIEELKVLRTTTDHILRALRAAPSRNPEWAVIWSSVHCCEARWVLTDEGEQRAEVLIAKACYDNESFRAEISKRLEAEGHHGVEVEMEW